jgi:CBS domain containing-hemolysin-like protein
VTDPTLRVRFRDFLQRLAARRGEEITEDWVQALVEAGQEEGIIAKDENEMIRGIFDLRDTVVREVMVPRPQVAALPADASLEDFLALLNREGHSRVPVYDRTLDNVIGVVYSKDLLRHWGRDPKTFRVREVVRTPLFVPDSKRVKDLLDEFRRNRVHIAIVVDEYGATAGIVTIEDLIEEIIGEIKDEYDAAEEDPIKRLEDGTFSVDPRVNLADLEDAVKAPLPAEAPTADFDTVGGLIFHLAGRVPRPGETVRAGAYEFTVERASERRLGRVRVRILDAATEAAATEAAAAPGEAPAAPAAPAERTTAEAGAREPAVEAGPEKVDRPARGGRGANRA